MRNTFAVPQSPLRFLGRQIPAWLGMGIYAIIQLLLLAGCLVAALLGIGGQPQPFSTYLSTFMFPSGGIALLLAPLAYGLLRWQRDHAERPRWRQRLLPLWMGVVTYIGLALPLNLIVSALPGGWLLDQPPGFPLLLVGVQVCALAGLAYLLLHSRWFPAGLLLGYALATVGLLALGSPFLGEAIQGSALVIGYAGCVLLLSVSIVVSAIRQALRG
jgi:hypothetical protein